MRKRGQEAPVTLREHVRGVRGLEPPFSPSFHDDTTSPNKTPPPLSSCSSWKEHTVTKTGLSVSVSNLSNCAQHSPPLPAQDLNHRYSPRAAGTRPTPGTTDEQGEIRQSPPGLHPPAAASLCAENTAGAE